MLRCLYVCCVVTVLLKIVAGTSNNNVALTAMGANEFPFLSDPKASGITHNKQVQSNDFSFSSHKSAIDVVPNVTHSIMMSQNNVEWAKNEKLNSHEPIFLPNYKSSSGTTESTSMQILEDNLSLIDDIQLGHQKDISLDKGISTEPETNDKNAINAWSFEKVPNIVSRASELNGEFFPKSESETNPTSPDSELNKPQSDDRNFPQQVETDKITSVQIHSPQELSDNQQALSPQEELNQALTDSSFLPKFKNSPIFRVEQLLSEKNLFTPIALTNLPKINGWQSPLQTALPPLNIFKSPKNDFMNRFERINQKNYKIGLSGLRADDEHPPPAFLQMQLNQNSTSNIPMPLHHWPVFSIEKISSQLQPENFQEVKENWKTLKISPMALPGLSVFKIRDLLNPIKTESQLELEQNQVKSARNLFDLPGLANFSLPHFSTLLQQPGEEDRHHFDPLHVLREIMDLSTIVTDGTQSGIKPSLHMKVASARLHESPHVQQHWNDFLKSHKKQYSPLEEHQRKRKWLENIIRIHNHNEQARQGLQSYYLGANPLSDMGVREYNRKKVKLSHRGRAAANEMKTYTQQKRDVAIPEEWNWVEQGFVTPTWDQEDCGSCYAFSIATSAEGQYFRKTKQLINLSAQQLVDCSTATGNHGCNGGSLRNTLRYCLRSRGLVEETNYPYRGKLQGCRFHAHQRRVNITSYVILPEGDEEAIKRAVATVGPVACSINASPYTFQLYQKGIYDDYHCSSRHVNHAMVIVGYTKDAWILKNWWGRDWGMDGYMHIRRGNNRCAVAKYAAYPIVDEVPLLETISKL